LLLAVHIKAWYVLCGWHMANKSLWMLPVYSHSAMGHANRTSTLSTTETGSLWLFVCPGWERKEEKKGEKYAPTRSCGSKELIQSGITQGAFRLEGIYTYRSQHTELSRGINTITSLESTGKMPKERRLPCRLATYLVVPATQVRLPERDLWDRDYQQVLSIIIEYASAIVGG